MDNRFWFCPVRPDNTEETQQLNKEFDWETMFNFDRIRDNDYWVFWQTQINQRFIAISRVINIKINNEGNRGRASVVLKTEVIIELTLRELETVNQQYRDFLRYEHLTEITDQYLLEKFRELLGRKNQNSIQKLFPNLILYGPPGTGKTYNTKAKAVEIIGKPDNKTPNERYRDFVDKGQISFITFHQSYSYEQFVEGISVETKEDEKTQKYDIIYKIKPGIFKQICEKAKVNSNDNYVLIIDEINRGNISKIFGELITLIEPDKRLGKENEIIVDLPYSGEKFGVPPNLYIIVTMNTADRSLVQLDTALRRRFAFEEMMPKYEEDGIEWKNGQKSQLKINEVTLNLSEFLKILNEQIIKYKDRDHQIGHSYLMNVNSTESDDYEKSLKFAWCNQIMPLLQEYFYNDLESLHIILGESEFLKKGKNLQNEDDGTFKLNLKVGDFKTSFKKIYDHLIPKVNKDTPKSGNEDRVENKNIVE